MGRGRLGVFTRYAQWIQTARTQFYDSLDVRIQANEHKLDQYISPHGESIPNSVVFRRKPLRPIASLCLECVASLGLRKDSSQSQYHQSAEWLCQQANQSIGCTRVPEPDHRLKSERWSHCSSWSPWNQHSFGCRHSPKTGVGAIVNSVVTVTLENNLNADDSPRGNLNLTI